MSQIKTAAQRAQIAVSNAVEANAKRLIDGALDAKDTALSGVAKGIGNTWGAAASILEFPLIGELVGFGVSIGMLAAPVPVGVGLGILWLFDSQIKDRQNEIESRAEKSKKRRKHERVVRLLKKFGEIPEMAILETRLLRIVLDSKTGDITGQVLQGALQGLKIEDLDHYALFQLIQTCDEDPESKEILEAINHIRVKKIGVSK